ncbi:hypothetical protein [Clostridium perfringens]
MKKLGIDFEKREFEYNGCEFVCYRTKNDTYGNPMYRIEPINFNVESLRGKGGVRVYAKNCYALVQSYDIDSSIARLLKDIK